MVGLKVFTNAWSISHSLIKHTVLTCRMAVIHADNERLREELERLQETRIHDEDVHESEVEEETKNTSKVLVMPDKLIPGENVRII